MTVTMYHNLVTEFYTAFANGDPKKMIACYHQNIGFEDPAFGRLSGDRARKMWEMLLSNKAASPEITFSNVEIEGNRGSANWEAKYVFGPKKRHVHNTIKATFRFEDGKIIDHKDVFNLWKWSRQALGPSGVLLGWSPIMKKKIRSITNKQLDIYINKTASSS